MRMRTEGIFECLIYIYTLGHYLHMQLRPSHMLYIDAFWNITCI